MLIDDYNAILDKMTDEEILAVLEDVADDNIQSPEISEYLDFLHTVPFGESGIAGYNYQEKFDQSDFGNQVSFAFAA